MHGRSRGGRGLGGLGGTGTLGGGLGVGLLSDGLGGLSGGVRLLELILSRAVLGIHLAYVVTGDGLVDETSRTGLDGLGGILRARTAVDARPALGVDPERDDLSLYPLVYWPMTAAQKPLSAEALGSQVFKSSKT